MRIIISIFSLTVLLYSCKMKAGKEFVLDYKYIGGPDYTPDKKYDLRMDTLVIAFAGNFDSDTVNIQYDKIDTTIIMSTDEVTGLACDLRLGKIVESNLILKISNYKAVKILINKDNQLFLVEKYDSLLRISPRYYLPGFY